MFFIETGGVASSVNNPISKIANFDLCKVNAVRCINYADIVPLVQVHA